jgi:hypothetical protein
LQGYSHLDRPTGGQQIVVVLPECIEVEYSLEVFEVLQICVQKEIHVVDEFGFEEFEEFEKKKKKTLEEYWELPKKKKKTKKKKKKKTIVLFYQVYEEEYPIHHE